MVSDSERTEYYRRLFEVIDGLWFMMVEKKLGFEEALETDVEVWGVVPKIQARKIRELAGIEEKGTAQAKKALKFKFDIEGFDYEMNDEGNGISIKINRCPWYEIMKKSGRAELAEKVGRSICTTEYPVFIKEYVDGANFSVKSYLCSGRDHCEMEIGFDGEDSRFD